MQQDELARNEAWQKFDRSEGWPRKDSYSFRVGFDAGWDARGRYDAERIAELEAALTQIAHMPMGYPTRMVYRDGVHRTARPLAFSLCLVGWR